MEQNLDQRTVCGSAWKDELKINIYRACHDALRKAKEQNITLIEALESSNIQLSIRRAGYCRKGNAYIAFVGMNDIMFPTGDMPIQRWEGWKLLHSYANKIGESSNCRPEKQSVGEAGVHALELINQIILSSLIQSAPQKTIPIQSDLFESA